LIYTIQITAILHNNNSKVREFQRITSQCREAVTSWHCTGQTNTNGNEFIRRIRRSAWHLLPGQTGWL